MTAPFAVQQVPAITDIRAIHQADCAAIGFILTFKSAGVLAPYSWASSDTRSDDGNDILTPTDSTGAGRWNKTGLSFPNNGGVASNGNVGVLGPPNGISENGCAASLESYSINGLGGVLASTGFGSASPTFHCHKAGGTPASPSAPAIGDRLFDMAGRAYLPSACGFDGSSFALLSVLKAVPSTSYTPNTITLEGTGTHSSNREVWLSLDNSNLTLGAYGALGSARFTLCADAGQSAQVWSSNVYSTGMAYMASGSQLPAGGENGAAAMFYLRKDSGTGRSINAAGTINASGADYAEYETLAPNVGAIPKGAIVGFDKNGLVTDKWADSVSFAVKSTNPAYVGGDVWGEARPECQNPPHVPSAPNPPTGEAIEAHRAALAKYHIDVAAHEIALGVHAVATAEWEAAHQEARAGVDRIAYCGKVPVNVWHAKPGDYIIPVKYGPGIAGVAVRWKLWRTSVGRVRRILPDGRAEIAS